MTTDLTNPVIVAQLSVDGESAPLLIDGAHRLYRAWRESAAELPAHVLTVAETKKIKYDDLIIGSAGAYPKRRTRSRRAR